MIFEIFPNLQIRYNFQMGEGHSKQVVTVLQKLNKQNIQPTISISKTIDQTIKYNENQELYKLNISKSVGSIPLPTRALFSYMQPLGVSPQDLPINDILSAQTQMPTSFQSFNGSSSMVSSTLFTLIHTEQIKVNWNSFIKMKNRNYLDDYTIIKKIGRGGFGVVSKVKSIHTHVFRAAKVIKKNQLNPQDHQKLLDQLAIMKSLDHPNIIKLYQVYDFLNQYTLIMQLCCGGELYSKIKGKRIPEKLVLQYMQQIIRTLVYLHSQGVVHRDLKPENMLLQRQGSNFIKFIDFGLAKRIKSQESLTQRVGTPKYMAPQVIYKNYNQKCDIWAAGVIFYMMLIGTTPFDAKNDSDLLQKILRDQPNFTSSSYWKNYTQPCKQALKLMLQKKQQRRPSASELTQHEWFSVNEQSIMLKQESGKICLNNIRSFKFRNQLQAVVNTYIASQLLTWQQKQILVNIFLQLDINKNGVIQIQQLKLAMDKQKTISFERLQILKRIIDTNQSGEIDYTEFLVASLRNQQFVKREYFQKAFAYFDIDHSGKISYQEVNQFLSPYQQDQDQIRKMFVQVDQNGDGEIDQTEFIMLFVNNTEQLKLLWTGNTVEEGEQFPQ